MRLSRKLMATAAVLAVSAGVALAATSPSGTFNGAVRSTIKGKKNTFDVTATFKKGKLTALTGKGNPGVIPYSPSKSTSTYCGAANSYDDTGTTITETKPAPKGFDFEFVIQPKNQSGYGWFTVTLKGNWNS